jgi:hypothetical protein
MELPQLWKTITGEATVDRPKVAPTVKIEVRKVLGDHASDWMARPTRVLDGIAPLELATSPEGARVVLHELSQASTPLGAAMARLKKRA